MDLLKIQRRVAEKLNSHCGLTALLLSFPFAQVFLHADSIPPLFPYEAIERNTFPGTRDPV